MALESLAPAVRARCGRGGIGRRAGFRSRSPLGVEVRILSPAPSPTTRNRMRRVGVDGRPEGMIPNSDLPRRGHPDMP